MSDDSAPWDDDKVAAVFPVIGWEAIVGVQPVCLMRVGYVRNPEEGDAARAGHIPVIVPLGFTADQCRQFAADLLSAADAIEGISAQRPH